MDELIEGIFEFNKKVMSNAFIREEKSVSNAIQEALSQVYLNDGNEIDLVEKTIETLNSSRSWHFKLESIFIHGNRSQIEFTYYGKKAKKELGDLLLVSTLTRNGKPLLQKLTIIQAKRDTNKPYTWGIDKEQLFFLSNWPEFKGVMGIFPSTDLAIPDYSGCLGAYYLYREPGDFVFVSAKELDKMIGSKKRVVYDDLLKIQDTSDKYHSTTYPYIPSFDPDELFYLYEKYLRRFYKMGHFPSLFLNYFKNSSQILQNISFCKNINETIGNLARLNIGEIIFAKDSVIPVNEFGYRMLNTIIRYIARREQGRLGQLLEFNSEAPFFEDINLDGVRIGVVHTITEVSQG